jgi:hypothetical protein
MNRRDEVSVVTADLFVQLARQRIADLRRDGARLRIADR